MLSFDFFKTRPNANVRFELIVYFGVITQACRCPPLTDQTWSSDCGGRSSTSRVDHRSPADCYCQAQGRPCFEWQPRSPLDHRASIRH